MSRITRSWTLRIWIEQGFKVPATIVWKLANPIHALLDQRPQPLRRGDPTRIAAAHADDRDRLVASRGRRVADLGRAVGTALTAVDACKHIVRHSRGGGVVKYQR